LTDKKNNIRGISALEGAGSSLVQGASPASTTCCYCGVGCGIRIEKDKQGALKLTGDTNHPVNKGMLCSKGMNLLYTVTDTSDRLLYPEMRYAKHLPRQRVSWDTALERTAAVFKTLIEKYGPDSVAVSKDVRGNRLAVCRCIAERPADQGLDIGVWAGQESDTPSAEFCHAAVARAYIIS
jgi:anaerobic selenocysteine-containing dehydrogenase